MASAPDEWFTAPVLFSPGRFTDDHPVRRRITDTEDGLSSALVETASRAVGYGSAKGPPVPVIARFRRSQRRRRVGFAFSWHPHIDAERVEIRAPLMFGFQHYGYSVETLINR